MLSNKQKEKIFILADVFHQRFFGHPMGAEMRKFLGSLSWSFIGGGIYLGMTFVIYLLAGRLLGPVQFGFFQTIFVISQWAVIPMLFGFQTATTKSIAESGSLEKKRLRYNTAFSVVLFNTVFFGALLFVLSNFLSQIFRIEDSIFEKAIFFSMTLAMYTFFRSLYQGLKKFKLLAVVDSIYALISLGVFLLLYKFSDFVSGYDIVWTAFFFGYLFVFLISIFLLRARIEVSLSYLKRILFPYASVAIWGSVAGFFLTAVDRVWVGYFLGPQSLGVYTAYLMPSMMVISQGILIFIGVLFPEVSSAGKKEEIFRKILHMRKYLFIGSFLFSFLGIVVTFSFLGESYPLSILNALLLSCAAGIVVLYQIEMWFLNALSGNTGIKVTVKYVFIAGMINLIFGGLLIQRYEIIGAIGAMIISGTVLYILINQYLRKYFHFFKKA